MAAETNHRVDIRIKHKTAIQFENYYSGAYYKAKMYNYSQGGMYFEADYAPLPGTEIYIGVKKSPYDAAADVYHAQIRWRKQLLAGASPYQYGVGVKYCPPGGSAGCR